jgi:hypothetical protein
MDQGLEKGQFTDYLANVVSRDRVSLGSLNQKAQGLHDVKVSECEQFECIFLGSFHGRHLTVREPLTRCST